MKQLVNGAATYFQGLREATRKQLKEMQGTPIGTEERSPQEQAALWRKITALPDPEFQGFMDFAALKANHQNDEEKPCELCRFIVKNVSRRNGSAKS